MHRNAGDGEVIVTDREHAHDGEKPPHEAQFVGRAEADRAVALLRDPFEFVAGLEGGIARQAIPVDLFDERDQRSVGDRLRGWACRTRTAESVRELPDWNYVTTSFEVGAGRAAETPRVQAASNGFAAPAEVRFQQTMSAEINPPGPTPFCTRLLS